MQGSASLVGMLVAAVALAGCVGGDRAGEDAPDDGTRPPDADAWTRGRTSNVNLVLGADMSMLGAPAPEAWQVMPLGWGWSSWLAGEAPPEWTGSVGEAAIVITAARAVVQYSALDAATTTGQRPEFTVWWGTPGAWVHHAFLDGPDALAPGQEVEAVFELRVPEGGMVVPAGRALALRIGSYYVDSSDQQNVGVRLGGPEATRLELVVAPVALPELVEADSWLESGQLRGGRCLGADADPEAMRQFAVPVEGNESLIHATLTRTGGTGPPDIDMALLSPAGDTMIRGQGSQAAEEFWAYKPTLDAGGPGGWTLVVYNCTPQESTFEVTLAAYAQR